MEFKNTRDFFERIRKGNLYAIDELNYLEKITSNYNYEKVEAVFMDLAAYIGEISSKKEQMLLLIPFKLGWKLKKLEAEGKEIPTRKVFVVDPPEGVPEEYEENDLLGMFSDVELIRLFSFQNRLEAILESKEAELTTEEDQEKKSEMDLHHFFKELDASLINDITEAFKNYKGKKLAIIIYLLDKKFNKIDYSLNSRTNSRKKFAALFTQNPKIKMSGIDKYFDAKRELTFDTDGDSDYQVLEVGLLKILEKEVV